MKWLLHAGQSQGQGRLESSFATVAALVGDVPLLLPFRRRRSGRVVDYELRGNKGRAMRNFFWIEDVMDANNNNSNAKHSNDTSHHRRQGRSSFVHAVVSSLYRGEHRRERQVPPPARDRLGHQPASRRREIFSQGRVIDSDA